jgi:hypothetical protein
MDREISETSTSRSYVSRTQAHREGCASVCNALSNNLRNIKDKRTHKKHATPFQIHMLPLLHLEGWEQAPLQKYMYVQEVLCITQLLFQQNALVY